MCERPSLFGDTMRRMMALILAGLMLAPVVTAFTSGNEATPDYFRMDDGIQLLPLGQTEFMPERSPSPYPHTRAQSEIPWWQTTSMDQNRNGIHDSLETLSEPVGIGLSYSRDVTESDVELLESMGYAVRDVIEAVDAVLLGIIDSNAAFELSRLDGVVMVERYGQIILWGDIQTPNIKAEPSVEYPLAAWNHTPLRGAGINIAMVDTGTDNEHPGLNQKFVAGYDAVCYMHTDPNCVISGFGSRETDGSFDPDDGNQHGTACMGMAAATGLDANGEQTGFEGSAPNASLVDVRIGTDAGAGPFENYLLSQEFYESAMNGLQWIIDNKDTAWPGVDESLHGIDIISLSWGITSHENGGSDGQDMHSRILDEATLEGIAVSVAAGNDGPNNDGLSGMGSSSLSMTIGATDDMNTVNRSDDEIAGYSSRGPRRDNGDNNPINELKPDLSAPGTDIVQAEACVTSGSCNNFLGGDASENGYTGRGSGTSYATPAVTGVIALMWEVNPALDPLQIREILRATAEQPGAPSLPEIDPVWNRDFGWGMVDALAAVEMAIFLNESETDLETLDIDLQMRKTSIQQNGSVHRTDGIVWARSGSVDSVQYRIDGGEWREATYEVNESGSSALVPVNWSVVLDVDMLSAANHSVEVIAMGGNGSSLPIIYMVQGTGKGLVESSDSGIGKLLFFAALLLLVLVAGAYASVKQARENNSSPLPLESFTNDEEQDEVPLEAEIIDVDDSGG